MPKLPRVSGKRIISALERLGFVRVRSRGSHVVMARSGADGRRAICVVPLHDEVAVGTLRGILRQGDVAVDEFMAALRR
jgi:predicted RNA binding protein YcfA (HicA-like mRNA interferase family)